MEAQNLSNPETVLADPEKVVKQLYRDHPEWFKDTGAEENSKGELIVESLIGFALIEEKDRVVFRLKRWPQTADGPDKYSYIIDRRFVPKSELGIRIPDTRKWDRLYRTMRYLETRPTASSVELDKEDYDFCKSIGFVSEDEHVEFLGKRFYLV